MHLFRLLALILCLAAPAAAQDGTITTGTGTTSEQAQADAAIATKIRDILHELDGYEDVTVVVKSGIVTLRGTTLDVSQSESLNGLVGRVEGVVAIENEVGISTDVRRRLTPMVERVQLRFWQAVAFMPLVGVALIAFAIVLWIGFFIARRRQPWDRLAPNAFIADIIRAVIRIAAIVAAVVVALDILGATALLSTILGAAGIIGLAIGFAVRDTVENFIASVLLSVRQPFAPNDAICIDGEEGKVIRLTSRATIMLSFDGNHIRIPNSTVFKSKIINYTRNPERRFAFALGVAYGTDLAKARELAEETLKAMPFVLDTPAVSIWTTELGGSDIGMNLTAWIDQRETGLLAARSEAIRQVLLAFDEAGIQMPEPTYRLLMSDTEAEADAAPPQATAASPGTSEVQNVEATLEHDLENIVDAERDTEREDLLRSDAIKE
ncbi:mechanosensitive ion channel family protein [Maritimibacter sp. UBA3975]|uniref:mechanosensitive ion channel family protein n=1 Tax=Maritimibacter sp. UBA3975 TaxID=1946833 RepID=UPI000C0985DA|nr:mechanosensitive ion channel family protein [Maritimibacter sp. UBA3975]MAM62525.1 mechanosensitive ion channel protein MscS [Maritimibacter sp.]|tara:strand:- start:206 stop:1519 length:1314 start_codon:yes stop_codon:yes gene_type:complete